MFEVEALGPDVSPGLAVLERQNGESSSSRTAPAKTPAIRVVSLANEDDEGSSEEELAWTGRTLVWSRGCEVYRQMSFDHDNEQVAFALFTPFRRGEDTSAVTNELDKGKGKGKAGSQPYLPNHIDATFGPFHRGHQAQWGRLKLHNKGQGNRLERTLTVFLQTKAYIFFPSGEDIVVNLPFLVDRAWPISTGGIIVQRKLEAREVRAMQKRKRGILHGMQVDVGHTSILDNLAELEEETEELPRLWSLERPFEEFKMITDTSALETTKGVPSTSDSLYIAKVPCPIVVVHDTNRQEIVFYRRQKVDASSPPPAASPTLSMARLSPEDALRPADAPSRSTRSRPSLTRNPSTFAPSASQDRRASGQADPLQRVSRRAPRMSRGTAPDKEPAPASAAGELQATLDPPPFTYTVAANNKPSSKTKPRSSRVSNASSMTIDNSNRRTSSAFIRAAAPAAENRAVLAVGGIDLKETTMVMGLEQRDEAVRSDITLHKIGSWSPPSALADQTYTIFESDNFWPDHVRINLQIGSSLYVFKVNHRSAWLVDSAASVSAVPVIATRSRVHDTLVLDPAGTLRILTSGGRSIPLNLLAGLSDGHDDVARRMASSLSMHVDAESSSGPAHGHRRIVGLEHATNTRVSLVYEDGERLRVSTDFIIKDRLVRQCFEAISCLPNRPDFFVFKRELLGRMRHATKLDRLATWMIFVDTLRDMLDLDPAKIPLNDLNRIIVHARQSRHSLARKLGAKCEEGKYLQGEPRPARLLFAAKLDRKTDAVPIMFALNLVAQDCRCLADRQDDVLLLGHLLLEISGKLGLVSWWDYWRRRVPRGEERLDQKGSLSRSHLQGFEVPPDIVDHLTYSLTCKRMKPFPDQHGLSEGTECELGPLDVFPHTRRLTQIYARMSADDGRPIITRAHDAVRWMTDNGVTTTWIQSLSFGIAMPIWEMVRICQTHPPSGWTSAQYTFIDRSDLAAKISGLDDVDAVGASPPEDKPTIGDLMHSDSFTTKPSLEPEVPHVRYGSDRRLAEAERIMQMTRVRTISVESPKGASEQDIMHYHQSVVNTLAFRTLSISVGSGIFEYGTRRTAIADVYNVPMIELSVKVLPGNSILKAQLAAENADWPCFHNGVSAALSIAPDAQGIDSSWIISNRPASLGPEHGGFLLGLGLTGHLRSLMAYHAFPYMEPRHDYTSCGLLLGLACSFAGSQDTLVTKVLSLHTHSLLPLGSAELNASAIVQSAALVGLGLVHVGTRHLRTAEVALSEIGRDKLPGIDHFEDYKEAYSFSASMAFGLIMLGRGGQQSSEIDRRLRAKLRRCIMGDTTVGHNPAQAIDTTFTAPGATLAFGLMYLKTGDRDARDMLEIPQTVFEADHARPDILLIRTLARALIMWEEINPSLAWIEAQLPPFLQNAHGGHKKSSNMEVSSELAYFYVMAGASMAIGLKCAGTGSELAHNNLLFLFSVMAKAAGTSSSTYEAKIRRHAARQCLSVVILALGAVMSGTGELNVFRRLRICHGHEGAGVTYGSHMAVHMAVGMLFLGRGHYTLGNSNLAIAAMCIAFFPRFQATPSDNKAYPQAFRHLWALAVEPRCLVARDVDTKETVYLPLKLKVQEGPKVRTQYLISPTLVTPFESILSIETDSPRYWPVVYDLSKADEREALVRTRTVYVKRRAAYLDYNRDPKGNRTMVVRAGSISGFDLLYDLLSPAAPLSIPAEECQNLIQAHDPRPDLLALVNRHSSDSAFDTFVRLILLECVSLDKTQLIGVYIAIWLAVHGTPDLRIEHMAQLGLLEDFYSPLTSERFWQPTYTPDKRPGWIRPNFLATATRLIAGPDGPSPNRALVDYLNIEDCHPDLAVYLAKHNVPSVEFLRAMRNLVVGAGTDDFRFLETRVRAAARTYAETLQRQYDASDKGAIAQAKVWKLDSIRDLISMWLGVPVDHGRREV